MTQTGLANKGKPFLLFEVAANSWESPTFQPTMKFPVSRTEIKCLKYMHTLTFIESVTSRSWVDVGTSRSQWWESL